ncbi:MAG: DNA-directed RNA polymerase subunit A' [Candidatus Methanoliparum thermophilum]|uniref:DNA-directed RNA polymerase subunit Rpo1N n=1 Tax=Methanoliparum thermophilum TaxID=2491083 RepID=A0A520KTI2_METT2|nr:DNA-directed RNA polymerase subunit A' [Candidatus Methanoliparum sp. LAM-1]RZN64875.1 MAG: DNA-directed RNA polymerase subunit A' [Candidatus Methanoliparum thermophilum]BDC36252.1 DNA-directed RNA polymerase subunit A' [Candidatus Methanoliparum sp. LAM-1]
MSIKKIGKIKFGILSPSEIRKMSAVKIITAETYDKDGYPIEKGLMDQHLGVIDPGLICKTCGGKVGECQGHFGHIELSVPVIHVGFSNLIARILKSTCRHCGRLLLSEESKKDFLDNLKQYKEIGQDDEEIIKNILKESSNTKICPYCGEEQKIIKFEKPTSYRESDEKNQEGEKLSPAEVRDRLERIPNEDLELLGIDSENVRPEWMVLTVLPIPPVTVRPSITLESSQRSEDDLTHKLVDIIRINQRFQENKEVGAPQLIIEDLWELLQYHVTTFFDNETSGIPPARHRSGRALKTLSQRLKGKEGRFRGNLSGKRVNFSARAVISPDPNLKINEVGVPLKIAKELTIPVVVNNLNIEMIKKFLLRGDEYPGTNYVIKPNGERIKITDKTKDELSDEIDLYWVIERHLIDGDLVLFNRQPSLHRMSMMAHKVKVFPGNTFRLNPAVCHPYNADFDGDEMNLHVLQSDEARAEAEIIMGVENNMISPRFGGPIIGGIHDHITGIFILTEKERKISKKAASFLLKGITFYDDSQNEFFDSSKININLFDNDEDEYITGKQIFSIILPNSINLEYRAGVCQNCAKCKKMDCPNDAYVCIKDGNLLSGIIDDVGVGTIKGKIFDTIIKEYGGDIGRQFLDNLTHLSLNSISYFGFSFGIDDEDIPEEAVNEIKEIIRDARMEIEKNIISYDNHQLEPLPGRTLEETLEIRIMQLLSKARDKSGLVASKHLGRDNPGVIMAISGARGSILNLTQMVACIGQQSVRGERISRGYNGRALPHFKKGDLSAEAKGFVKSNYKKGLSPTEFFFHAVGGREGLVDTAVRTSQSGYLQRRLINALQDLKVDEDRTVRGTDNVIVQFKYGEDGVDPMKSDYGEAVDVKKIVNFIMGEE